MVVRDSRKVYQRLMDDFRIDPPLVVKDQPRPRRLRSLAEARAFVAEAMKVGRPEPWREVYHRLTTVGSDEDADEAIGDLRELLEICWSPRTRRRVQQAECPELTAAACRPASGANRRLAASLSWKDQARGRAVREQAPLLVGDAPFGGADAPAAAQNGALSFNQASFRCDGPQQ